MSCSWTASMACKWSAPAQCAQQELTDCVFPGRAHLWRGTCWQGLPEQCTGPMYTSPSCSCACACMQQAGSGLAALQWTTQGTSSSRLGTGQETSQACCCCCCCCCCVLMHLPSCAACTRRFCSRCSASTGYMSASSALRNEHHLMKCDVTNLHYQTRTLFQVWAP